MLRQGGVCLGGTLHPRAGGDVIKDHGLARRVRHGVVVADEPLLSGLVVVGGHHQQRVRTRLYGISGHSDGALGVVRAGAGNDRNPTVHMADRRLDGPQTLLIAHGRGLAGGAADHQGVRAVLQLEVQQAQQGGIVHLSAGKGGDKGRAGPGKNRLFHVLPPDVLSCCYCIITAYAV